MTPPELVARMLNTMAEGLALATLVWLALRWSKPLNSGTRFAVWFSTLAAIVALPFIGFAAKGELSAAPAQPKFVLPESLATYLLAAWGFVALIFLVRLGLSLLHVRNLRRSSWELPLADLDPNLRDVLTVISRRVRLLVSDRVRVPAALGFFRPAIVLPRWTLNELPTAELRIVLLHELAHLRRWDDWTNLAQKLLKAVFFFHPAVWWIESRLSLEREMACDDMVLASTPSPRAYASSLLSLAERVGLGKTLALAQAALGHARHTSLRIAQILDVKRPRAMGIWKPALGLGAGIATVAFLAVPFAPELVAFENFNPGAPSLAALARPGTTTQPAVPDPTLSLSKGLATVATPGRTRVSPVSSRTKIPAQRPVAIRAAGKPDEVAASQMVLVMQSTQFDDTGVPVWTLCVWQITDRNRQQVRTEIVLHSL